MLFDANEICPYLKGSTEGAVCLLTNGLIREAGLAGIHQCFDCHEKCHFYQGRGENRTGGIVRDD